MGETTDTAGRAARLSLTITAAGSGRWYVEAPWKVFGPLQGLGDTHTRRTAASLPIYYLGNCTAGILEGDRLAGEIVLAEGARARILTPSAAKVYSMKEGCASQTLNVRLKRDSYLCYLPCPLIPFAGSVFSQMTSFDLDAGASLVALDVVAAGRLAHGERFAFKQLRLRARISLAGRLVLADHALIEPGVRNLSRPGVVSDEMAAVGTLYVAGEVVSRTDVKALAGCFAATQETVIAGITQPHAQLLVVRAMGASTESVELSLTGLLSKLPPVFKAPS